MAVSSAERTDLIKLVVGLYNAAPGAQYLNDLTVTYVGARDYWVSTGMNAAAAQAKALSDMANSLDSFAGFTNMYPVFQTNQEFANAWLATMGLGGSSATAQAVNAYVVSQLTAGADKGQLMWSLTNALSQYSGSDALFLDAKALLNNRIAAAEFFTVDLGGTSEDLGPLQNAIALVTSDPASVQTQNDANEDAITSANTFTLSVTPVSLTEGDSGSRLATFTLTLDKAPQSDVVVNFQTLETGTATANSDFTPTAGTVTFVPGQLSTTVSVIVRGDTDIEPDEAVNVEFTGAKLVQSVTSSATIVNDDFAPVPYVVTANDASVSEGDSGLTLVNITVSLDRPAQAPTSVNYSVTGGTATAGVDFVQLSGVIAFAVGQQNATITLQVNGDLLKEDDETVTLSLSVAGQTTGGDTATVTIVNDDDGTVILTTGIDNVQGGALDDVIVGDSTTFNSADSINGGGGDDVLSLNLVGQSGIYDAAQVVNTETVRVRAITGSDDDDTVTLEMTQFLGVERVDIVKSKEDIVVTDLQGTPEVVIDDQTDDVTINIDNQFVNGSPEDPNGSADDSIDITMKEFGKTAETIVTPTLNVDANLETVNITDASQAQGQRNNLVIQRGVTAVDGGVGFGEVNIDGGTAGVDFILENVFSGTGSDTVTVNSTALAGDLFLDVDGVRTNQGQQDGEIANGVDVVNSGEGADSIVGGDDFEEFGYTYAGTINTAGGNDSVLLEHNLSGDIDGGTGNDTISLRIDGLEDDGSGGTNVVTGYGDMYNGASIEGGTGDDDIIVGDMFISSSIDGDEGSDEIQVWGDVSGDIDSEDGQTDTWAIVTGGNGNDDITVVGDVSGKVQGDDGNDDIYVGDDVFGEVTGGEGDDDISVSGDVGNGIVGGDLVSGGNGNDEIFVGGDVKDDALVTAGEGNDTVSVVGNIDDDADVAPNIGDGIRGTVTLEGGDDWMQVWGTVNGLIQAGSGNDSVYLNNDAGFDEAGANDLNTGTVELGEGDDLLQVKDADINLAADVDGGPGNDALTMATQRHNGDVTVNIFADGDLNSLTDENNIVSIETLNLVTLEYVYDESGAVGLQDEAHNGFFNVNLDAFDPALDTINLNDGDFSNGVQGGTLTANLEQIEGEAITITSSSVGNAFGFAAAGVDEFATGDVELNVDSANQGSTQTLDITLWGDYGFDVELNDTSYLNTLNLTNDADGAVNRSIVLDGNDDFWNDSVLNLDGTATGNLTIFRAAQGTVNGATYAGNVYLQAWDDGTGNEDKSITLGSGNDYVDLTKDFLDLGDPNNPNDGDRINLSGTEVISTGTDRNTLAIDNSLINLAPYDEDQVFQGIHNVQILELNGDDGGVLTVAIEDDARDTGIDTINVRNDKNATAERGDVRIAIDADFSDDGLRDAPERLTVDVQSSDVDLENGSSVDMTVNLWSNEGYTNPGDAFGARPYTALSNGGGAGGAGINFDDTGPGDVDVNVAVNLVGATNVSNFADTTVAGNVRMTVDDGEIDSLTMLDLGGAAGGLENGLITVWFDDAWVAGGDLTVDASGVLNNDFDGNPADGDETDTGGMVFFGIMEDDAELTILGTQNDDTIMGGQDDDSIEGNDGDDVLWGDPELGQPVAPGVQGSGFATFDLTDDVEAGDSYLVTINGTTFSWTATSDSATVADAITALTAAIDGANVDGDPDPDVSATANLATGTITINGIDVDDEYGTGYALGEYFTVTAEAINRPTAIVNWANEPVDAGDTAVITIDGTPYSATAGALDTITDLQEELVADIDAGGQMDAELGSVVLRGNAPATPYEISAEWDPDLVTTPATSATATVTFTDLEVGETATVFFTGGVSVAAADSVANLVAALNGNATVAAQWTASAVGDVLTLTANAAGATPPSLAFLSAGISNGDGGVASWSTANGTDAVIRTDNTDPTIEARQASFAFEDTFYDAGDTVDVTVDGTTYSVVLPGADDTNHDGATVAGVVAAFLTANLPVNFTATAAGNVVTVTAPEGTTVTFDVAITDTLPLVAQPEIVDVDFTGFVPGPGLAVSVDFDGTAYSGATIGDLLNAINAATGSHGYTATAVGDVVTLTSDASGVEPAVDKGDISGAFTSDGGTVTVTPTPGVAAVPAEEEIDFSTMTDDDGAEVVLNGVTYSSYDVGTAAQSLQNVADQINAAGLDWTAAVTGTVGVDLALVLTGPVDGSVPAESFDSAAVLPDGGSVTAGAATAGVEAVPDTFTVTAVGFDPNVDSVSVTFDMNNSGIADGGDLTLSGFTWQDLADQINTAVGNGVFDDGGEDQISGAAVVGNSLEIYGQADGGTPSTRAPILATFAGTGGPASVATALGAAATPFAQTITVTTADAGETVYVEMSDGAVFEQAFTVDEATTLAALAAQIEAAYGLLASTIGAGTITLNGQLDGTNPTATASGGDIVGAAVATTSTSTAPAAAIPQEVDLDFVNLDDPDEVATVTLAGGFLSYSNTDLGDLVNDINADTATHGWTASVVGSVVTLTGPIDGSAPAIAFGSASLTETDPAATTEVQESWQNADNADPDLTFVSGLENGPVSDGDVDGVNAPVAYDWGSDYISGGLGDDTIMGMGGNDTLNGDDGDDSIEGGDGNDLMTGGTGADELYGGNGNDNINGGSEADWIEGNAGNDVLTGESGDDVLLGGDGNDNLSGGEGNDYLEGGLGTDIQTGGAGIDTFVFNAGLLPFTDSTGDKSRVDQITDYQIGVDYIDVNVAGANFFANVGGTTELIAALQFGGGAAGRIVYDKSEALLYVDTDGDGVINIDQSDIIVWMVGLEGQNLNGGYIGNF